MNLKLFRQKIGLSQTELANLTKLPRYKISLIEQGLYAPTKNELQQFIQTLNKKARLLLESLGEVEHDAQY